MAIRRMLDNQTDRPVMDDRYNALSERVNNIDGQGGGQGGGQGNSVAARVSALESRFENQAPNAGAPLKTDYNVVTTLLGALVGAVNATNARVNIHDQIFIDNGFMAGA